MEKEKTLEILEKMKAYYVRYRSLDPAYCEVCANALDEAIEAVKHKGEGALETAMAGLTDAVDKFLNGFDEDDSKPVLDEVEKKYLGNIIRPFRKRVIGITKQSYPTLDSKLAYIQIDIKSSRSDNITLPFFHKKSGMYSGMKPNRQYTLEELGL